MNNEREKTENEQITRKERKRTYVYKDLSLPQEKFN